MDNNYWRIGNSNSIKLWYDNWLGMTIMDRLGLFPCSVHSLQSIVVDFLVDHTSNIPACFAHSFPDIVVEMTQIVSSLID